MHSIRGWGTRLLIWIIATREKKTPYMTTIPHAKRADVLVKVSNLLFGNSYAPQETTHHTGRTGPSTGPHPDDGRNNAFTSSCRDVMAQPEDFLPEDFPGDHQKPFPPPPTFSRGLCGHPRETGSGWCDYSLLPDWRGTTPPPPAPTPPPAKRKGRPNRHLEGDTGPAHPGVAN